MGVALCFGKPIWISVLDRNSTYVTAYSLALLSVLNFLFLFHHGIAIFNCHLIVITVTIQQSRTTVCMTLMAAMLTRR